MEKGFMPGRYCLKAGDDKSRRDLRGWNFSAGKKEGMGKPFGEQAYLADFVFIGLAVARRRRAIR